MLGRSVDDLHEDSNEGNDNAAVLPAVTLINLRLFMRTPHILMLLYNVACYRLLVARYMFSTCNMQPEAWNILPSERPTISLISVSVK
jgi:hypothetical protein